MENNIQRSGIEIDITLGEALDRLSILNLKLIHSGLNSPRYNSLICEITPLHKQIFVKEYPRLYKIYYHKFCSINGSLWRLEDRIREQIHFTKPDIITVADIAQAICRFNDIRSRLKRRINNKCGQEGFIDEKIYT